MALVDFLFRARRMETMDDGPFLVTDGTRCEKNIVVSLLGSRGGRSAMPWLPRALSTRAC